ncbi:MAG: hypothetical protein ACI4U2_00270 [Christensenellaceae bacterium]
MKKTIEVKIPLEKRYMTSIRLLVGGVCAASGFDIDRTEDVKVCVTEALLLLSRNGYAEAEADLEDGEEQLKIVLSGRGEVNGTESAPEDDISYALLGALADESETSERDGRLVCVTLCHRK